MPLIAANLSDALYRAILQYDTPVDLIKVPLSAFPGNMELMAEAKELRPLLLHPFQSGLIDLTQWEPESALNPDGIKALLELTGTPSLSTHISMGYATLPRTCTGWTGLHLKDAALNVITDNCRRLKTLVEDWGFRIPLLLENHSATPWSTSLPFTATPPFLNEVTLLAGAELLLDLAHARISAWHNGVDAESWVTGYDLDRVGELHLSGPRVYGNMGMLDEHNSLGVEDWKLLDWVLQRTKPRIISLEYGGMGDAYEGPDGSIIECSKNCPLELDSQVRRLKGII